MEEVFENANSQPRQESLEPRRQASNPQPHAAPAEILGQALSLHGDGLPPLPGQQSLQGSGSHPSLVASKVEPPQGQEMSGLAHPKLRACRGESTLPWQQLSLEEKELPLLLEGQDHLASLTWLDGRAGQANPKLDSGKPELTGLEGLEVIPSSQKVLEWLQAHFPLDTWVLDCRSGTDEGLSRGLPTSSALGDARRSLASQCPALPQWWQAWPSRPAEQHPGHAGSATTAVTAGHALPALACQEALAPAVGAGACLWPAQPLGHGSPPATAAPNPARRQRRSLFGRVLRAVRRLFLGTRVPRGQEQQRRAASARQLPAGHPAQPQQRPAQSAAQGGTAATAPGTAPQAFGCLRGTLPDWALPVIPVTSL